MEEFDYDLDPSRIAQDPADPRDSARLLVDRGPRCDPDHLRVSDLPSLLGPGDILVVNDTRVLAARLRLRKPTGGAVEVLLLRPEGSGAWEALVRPSRKVAPGSVLAGADDASLSVSVGDRLGEGRRRVEVSLSGRRVTTPAEATVLDGVGELPLPPYIGHTSAPESRYQTVYATRPGSVAAPTAGLHLTDGLLGAVADRGVGIHTVELVVGLDTFRPVTAEDTSEHVMHTEAYRVPPATMAACGESSRVVAVGTTTVRALESAAASGCLEGDTDLFITRGHPWRVVDTMMTNFHMPRSTLLVMVDAFVGPRWRDLYDTALAGDYRFLSFGDAMLLHRATTGDGPHPGAGSSPRSGPGPR